MASDVTSGSTIRATDPPAGHAPSGRSAADRPWGWARLAASPVLWGGGLTFAFYAAIPVLPIGRSALQRYFCSHPLEYALVGLFFIGLAILTGRLLRLRREQAALSSHQLPATGTDVDLLAMVDTLEASLATAPSSLRETILHRRLRDACGYLRNSRSSAGLESHLKHLADVSADRLYDSYSLLLTINWAVPIIGFLGTVIGITLAIANVTPEQLDTSLNSVTGGLAVAFDTTTVAMSFSLVLVFAYDWIKRSEHRVLATVDDMALCELLPLFAAEQAASDPLVQAQADAARQLVDRTELLVQQQTQLWRESVDGLRERWTETLAEQQLSLSTSLEAGVESTLGDHAEQLRDVRQDFLSAFEQAAERFATALEQDRHLREDRDATAQQQFEQTWQRVNDDLAAVIRCHDAHAEDLVDRLTETVGRWQSGLERTTQAVDAQLERLQQLAETLLRLADQEQQLVRVERQLSENLETVQAAETFEQTLHNLTAAVHLLTARAKPRAA